MLQTITLHVVLPTPTLPCSAAEGAANLLGHQTPERSQLGCCDKGSISGRAPHEVRHSTHG